MPLTLRDITACDQCEHFNPEDYSCAAGKRDNCDRVRRFVVQLTDDGGISVEEVTI